MQRCLPGVATASDFFFNIYIFIFFPANGSFPAQIPSVTLCQVRSKSQSSSSPALKAAGDAPEAACSSSPGGEERRSRAEPHPPAAIRRGVRPGRRRGAAGGTLRRRRESFCFPCAAEEGGGGGRGGEGGGQPWRWARPTSPSPAPTGKNKPWAEGVLLLPPSASLSACRRMPRGSRSPGAAKRAGGLPREPPVPPNVLGVSLSPPKGKGSQHGTSTPKELEPPAAPRCSPLPFLHRGHLLLPACLPWLTGRTSSKP